jgi:hypothetical protein
LEALPRIAYFRQMVQAGSGVVDILERLSTPELVLPPLLLTPLGASSYLPGFEHWTLR